MDTEKTESKQKKEKKQPEYKKPSEADGSGCFVGCVFGFVLLCVFLAFGLLTMCSTPVDYEAHRQANKEYEAEKQSMEKANTLYEASRDVANSLK